MRDLPLPDLDDPDAEDRGFVPGFLLEEAEADVLDAAFRDFACAVPLKKPLHRANRAKTTGNTDLYTRKHHCTPTLNNHHRGGVNAGRHY